MSFLPKRCFNSEAATILETTPLLKSPNGKNALWRQAWGTRQR